MGLVNIKLNNIDELEKYGYDIMDKENVLNNKIKEILEERGFSQSDLSKLTGISRQNISDIIQNKLKPGVDFAIKIAVVLNVPVEDIFQLNESAWFKIAKLEDDTSIFLDLYQLKIIDNKERKNQLKEDNLEYYLIKENKCIEESLYKTLLDTYISKYPDKKAKRKDIIKEFDNTVCTKRYKKLVERISPLRLSK